MWRSLSMSGRDNRRWISLSARYSLCFWPGRFCREETPCTTMISSLMSLPLVRDIDILILPASLLVIIISRSIIGLVSGLFCGIRLLLPVHWCVGMPVIIWSRSRSVLHKWLLPCPDFSPNRCRSFLRKWSLTGIRLKIYRWQCRFNTKEPICKHG